MGFARGVLVSFILSLLLGWLPVVGPFVAGLIAGWVVRGGVLRGFFAAFVGVLLWFVVVGVLAALVGGLVLGPFGALVFGVAGGVVTLLLLLFDAVIAGLGGVVGSLLAGRL